MEERYEKRYEKSNAYTSYWLKESRQSDFEAKTLLRKIWTAALQPYSEMSFLLLSPFYPIAYAFNALCNLVKILLNALLFLEAWVDCPKQAIPEALYSIWYELVSFFCNLVSAILLVVTFFTRMVASGIHAIRDRKIGPQHYSFSPEDESQSPYFNPLTSVETQEKTFSDEEDESDIDFTAYVEKKYSGKRHLKVQHFDTEVRNGAIPCFLRSFFPFFTQSPENDPKEFFVAEEEGYGSDLDNNDP